MRGVSIKARPGVPCWKHSRRGTFSSSHLPWYTVIIKPTAHWRTTSHHGYTDLQWTKRAIKESRTFALTDRWKQHPLESNAVKGLSSLHKSSSWRSHTVSNTGFMLTTVCLPLNSQLKYERRVPLLLSIRWNLIVQISIKELLEKAAGAVGGVNRRLGALMNQHKV